MAFTLPLRKHGSDERHASYWTPTMISRRQFLATSALGALVTPRLLRGQLARSFDPWLEIDAAALRHNAEYLARRAGGRPIIAVAKNNAYGLGLEVAGPILDGLTQVTMLAVVRPDEALALRRANVRKPILLMGPASEEELLELVPLGVIQSPYRSAAPQILGRVAGRLGQTVRVHAYIDTGMHRMGMPVAEAAPWVASLAQTRGVRVEGAFTELVEDLEFDRAQTQQLLRLRGALEERGVKLSVLHAASSDAVLHATTESYLDAIRPGLALYGGYVSDRSRTEGGLRPAYRLKARVIRVDHLGAGEGVSYHRRWKTDAPAWIATLAVGHVDGYPSGAVKGCEILVRGKLFPVVGTVSASHTVIALGAERAVDVGDEAILIGPDDPALHPNEVAKRAGYSEYNMFMHLSPHLTRRVV